MRALLAAPEAPPPPPPSVAAEAVEEEEAAAAEIETPGTRWSMVRINARSYHINHYNIYYNPFTWNKVVDGENKCTVCGTRLRL